MLLPVKTYKEILHFTQACRHERVYGSKALTALRAYGTEDPAARFYVCMNGETPVAALYLANGVLTVSAAPEADAACFAELIRREGVHEIDTNQAQCEALQAMLGGITESSYYMVYAGGVVDGDFSDISEGEAEKVFDVLQRSHEYYRTHLTFDVWSADLHRKWDQGLMELYQLTVDGAVVGTGCIVSEDEECGVIAAVAVVPEYRHRGYGSHISSFLVRRIMEKGKTPRLISGYDEVAELYRKIGFVPCGRWGELYL